MDELAVYRCQCGDLHFHAPNEDHSCLRCGEEGWTHITDVAELQRTAEATGDRECAHRLSDVAMYERMKMLDNSLAEWYRAQFDGGWWYA